MTAPLVLTRVRPALKQATALGGSNLTGSGGLRKLRWNVPGRGKSGGIRTIYYWDYQETIYMLLCYQKNEQEDLTPKQLTTLRAYVKDCLL